MAKRSRGMKAEDYESIGTTYDGVRILKPITKPKSFTTEEIRETIRKVLREREIEQSRLGHDEHSVERRKPAE